MADNVLITQGNAVTTSIAAENISGVMYERVKLAVGTAGSTAMIPSDATYGLGVDIKRGNFELNTNNAAGDAFSRLRVSEPVTIFDSTFEYDLSPVTIEAVAVASGTAAHDGTNSGATLSVTTGSTDSITLQSRQYLRYQPGKSQLIAMTAELGTASAGTVRRFGYFDAQNGIFLEQNGTTDVAITLRRNGSDNRIVQASWNLDPMTGSGPSGHTLNLAKSQILIIDLQWLGVGRVRVGFDIDGDIDYVHEFLHANDNTGTYMKSACLPVSWSMANTTTIATTQTMTAFCSTVISEGGFEDQRGYVFAQNSTTAGVTVSTRRAVLSIRPSGTFKGLTTRGLITPEFVEISGSSGGAVIALAEVVYNPTFLGTPTWSTVHSESMVEYCQHGDASAGTFTGGAVIWQGFVAIPNAGASSAGRVSLGRALAARYPLVLGASGLSTSATAYSIVLSTLSGGQFSAFSSFGWKENR